MFALGGTVLVLAMGVAIDMSSLTASGSTYIPAGYSGGGEHYRLMHLLRTAPLLTGRNYSF